MCKYVKRKTVKCKTLKDVENRNEQFEHIAVLKNEFAENQLPVLSIDTKKTVKKMLILCDGGGSNHSGHHIVKEEFNLLAEQLEMEIVIDHYPPYCSKWNPIEHKAFSYISKKWQGVVFDNYDIIKELAEQTTTKTGFSVKAYINTKKFKTGRKASDAFMTTKPVVFDGILPKWNYKLNGSQ